jgi:uncharacterized repeat protein (TIGR03803 family)
MKTLARFALSISAAAMIASCGGSQPPIAAPGAMPQSRAVALAPTRSHHASSGWSYKVLFKFGYAHGTHGIHPAASLLDVNGTLYGTTGQGGVSGDGTVFSISLSAAETVLHSFSGGSDGAQPQAGLIDVNGTLYGTTGQGGASGDGTVFSISLTGAETVLHSFSGGSDGAQPQAGLIDVNGTLYGTTVRGGTSGVGTVFSISTSGSENLLYSFTGGTDGGYPYAGLIEVKGTLYGTTAFGGDLSCSGLYAGCGTVYSITMSGYEKVLHSFSGRHGDGTLPFAPLIGVKGTLYGTTAFGGSGTCGERCGTVYRITTAGAEKVLHSFGAASDGQYPHTGLLAVNGMLFGTTLFGGGGCDEGSGYGYGCGVAYSVSTSGKLIVLHRFSGSANSDGAHPSGDLINVNGTFYGVTFSGGRRRHDGFGTVFTLVQ